MSEKNISKLPNEIPQGIVKIINLPIEITVEKGSFLHIGGSPSPLTEKKAPVFNVDGIPIIPASSFKGAFRYQVEQLLIRNKEELKKSLKINDEMLLKPCIPAPRPSKAEKSLLNSGYRSHCEIKVEEDKIDISRLSNKIFSLCPVCYFFGSTGLMGFLRISNFWPDNGENKLNQTNIRIDRKSGTAASSAIVTGEQVKPGTKFSGNIELISQFGDFNFGYSRKFDETEIDKWLQGISSNTKEENQRLLVNQIIIPALNNIKILGGQKSKGAGKVNVILNY